MMGLVFDPGFEENRYIFTAGSHTVQGSIINQLVRHRHRGQAGHNRQHLREYVQLSKCKEVYREYTGEKVRRISNPRPVKNIHGLFKSGGPGNSLPHPAQVREFAGLNASNR